MKIKQLYEKPWLLERIDVRVILRKLSEASSNLDAILVSWEK